MNITFIKVSASVFEFLDRRWRRQAVWICTVPIIIGLISRSIVTGILLLIPATIVYLLWITSGTRVLTENRSKSLLLDAVTDRTTGLEDVSKNPGFKDTEILLGIYTKAGFVMQKEEDLPKFNGMSGFARRFSLANRFQVALVEIHGEKFVRKKYTPSDYKFFQALRNSLMIEKLGITPKLRYVNVIERSTWTEFVDGSSLHDLYTGGSITQPEKSGYAERLIEFKNLLHQKGLCNLDLHLGNIIVRRTDNRAMLVDIDEAKHYPSNSFLFQLYCIRDQKKVMRPVKRLTGKDT